MIVARRNRVACFAALGMLLWWPTTGKASTTTLAVDLEYEVAPGCPDMADFKAVVVARLDHDPFVGGAPDRVLVRMAPGGSSIAGLLEWRDASGKWTGEQTFPFVTSDCLRLARAMGFALAVQIQLLASTRAAAKPGSRAPEAATAEISVSPRVTTAPDASAPQGASIPTMGPPAASAAPAVALLVPAPDHGFRPALALAAGSAVGFGLSSTPILLGRIVGSLAWPRFSLELAAAGSLPATTRREDGAGFTQQEAYVSAAACTTASRWNGCVVANAGGVRLVGKDIELRSTAWAPLVEAGARLGLRQSLGHRTYITAYADGLIILSRWTASLDQVPVWTAPRFAAILGIDACVRIP